MAIDNSLVALLTTLTASIESATQAVPKDGIAPPKEGISLLDVKNDLLLSYIQNLVFLILLKLRSRKLNDGNEKEVEKDELQKEVTEKLVELRVYIEKGVRPLENRLKYQIDKIIRTADDAERRSSQDGRKPTALRTYGESNPDESGVSDAESGGPAQREEDVDDTSYGPNKAAFVRPKAAADKRATESSKDGVYRPPRITPMVMPTTQGREERKSRREGKSATIDEFVVNELSSAPLAEPSIGSTIVSGGRSVKSERERRDEAERREYEESNYVRLPAQSKKERAKSANRARNSGWGGEELRGLGAGLDRIERLTQKKSSPLNSLGRSRKRAIQDGPRGTGSQVGEAFEKRRKFTR